MLDRRSLTSATTIDGDNGLLETHVGDRRDRPGTHARYLMDMRRFLGPEDGHEKSGTANRNYSKSKKNA